MKTLESNHGNDWRDKLLNSWPFLSPSIPIKSKHYFAYCKRTSGWMLMSGTLGQSLFWNGTVFMRYTVTPVTPIFWGIGTLLAVLFSAWWLLLFTFGLFVHLSWRETGNRRYIQFGWGHKLNGRWGALLRIPKNDEQSSRGAHKGAPNAGQSSGWTYDTK